MNYTDEDLQKKFDDGNYPGEGIDAQAYQKVFDALKKEPEFTLPVYFADRLVNLIESKEKSREISRDNFWLGLGLFSFVIAFIVAFTFIELKLTVGVFQFFASYPGLILFGIAFIGLLNWLDKKIIRKVEAFS